MQLDDTIMKTIETAPNPELKESRDLILRIRRRNLYQVLELADDFFCTSYNLEPKREWQCREISLQFYYILVFIMAKYLLFSTCMSYV